MHYVARKVGRLLECRIVSPITEDEAKSFAMEVRALLLGFAERQALGCVDLRGAHVFSPEVSDLFTAVMRNDNPRIERSAFVVHPGALFGIQIERMLREAQNPARRTFREVAGARAYLGEEMTDPERRRTAEFLAEWAG